VTQNGIIVSCHLDIAETSWMHSWMQTKEEGR